MLGAPALDADAAGTEFFGPVPSIAVIPGSCRLPDPQSALDLLLEKLGVRDEERAEKYLRIPLIPAFPNPPRPRRHMFVGWNGLDRYAISRLAIGLHSTFQGKYSASFQGNREAVDLGSCLRHIGNRALAAAPLLDPGRGA